MTLSKNPEHGRMTFYNATKLRPVFTRDLKRLGRRRDGGYILNRQVLAKTKWLLSFGISTDWSFERDFLRYKQKEVVHISAFDFSVGFSAFIRKAFYYLGRALKFDRPVFHTLFAGHLILVAFRFLFFFRWNGRKTTFHKKGLGTREEGVFMSFAAILDPILPAIKEDEILIKMDIEGAEYEVILHILEYSKWINCISLEFHDLKNKSAEFERLVDQILQYGFVITHIHPNNSGGVIPGTNLPDLLEMTFSKKGVLHAEDLKKNNLQQYPLTGLDYPCLRRMPELSMPF